MYLTALVDALIDRAELEDNGCQFDPVGDSADRYEILRRRLFVEREPFARTQQASREAPWNSPFVFRMTIDGNGESRDIYNILLFDASGEQIQRKEYLQEFCRYIIHADGLIFIVDPTKFDAVRTQLPWHLFGKATQQQTRGRPSTQSAPPEEQSADGLFDINLGTPALRQPQGDESFYEDEFTTPIQRLMPMVANVLRDELRLPLGQPVRVPISLVVTKADLLRYAREQGNVIASLGWPGRPTRRYHHPDVLTAEVGVQKALREIAPPGLFANGVRHYSDVTYHMVSATGCPIQSNGKYGEIRPFRVIEPFGSVMFRMNIIR
jgi:hypothetical protein